MVHSRFIKVARCEMDELDPKRKAELRLAEIIRAARDDLLV